MEYRDAYDPIPLEDVHETHGPNDAGMMTHQFYAFNTIIILQAYADAAQCAPAFDAARGASRAFERRLSRTLPHSDISRLNAAAGKRVAVHNNGRAAARGHRVLRRQRGPVRRHRGLGGAAVELPRGHGARARRRGARAGARGLARAARKRGRRGRRVLGAAGRPAGGRGCGGVAKGWIADRLSALLAEHGLDSFVVNLGGNVMAHGQKPDGSPWRVGLQDPRDKSSIVGAVTVRDASAVTSGVYERCFERDGVFYHHILDPKTGFPVETDAAGATVVARHSIDAEGYSTTLLALGIERGIAFARERDAILGAYFVDRDGKVAGIA